MREFFTPPVFADPEQTQTARHLYVIWWAMTPAATLVLVALVFVLPQNATRWWVTLALSNAIGLALLGLARRGHTRLSSGLLAFELWATVTALAATAGGIRAQVTPCYAVVVLATGLLLGVRWGVVAGAGCALTALALVVAGSTGRLPASAVTPTDLSIWLNLILVIIALMALQYLGTRAVRTALSQARRELAERQRMEAAVREERNLLRTLIDAAPDHIYVMDRDRRIVVANVAQARALGLERPEEIVGTADEQLNVSADVVQMLRENDLAVLQSGRVMTFDEPYTDPTGELCCMSSTKAPLRDAAGEVIGLVGISRNVSEHRRALAQREAALAALEASEHKFRTIIEQFAEGFVLIDEQGRVVEWNQAVEDISGTKRDEVLGLPYWDVMYRFVAPERRSPERYEYIKAMVLEMLRMGEQSHSFPPLAGVAQRADGDRRFIEQTMFPIRLDTGCWIGCVIQDITARKRMDEALRENEERFRRIFEEGPLGMSLLDADFRYIRANEAFCRMVGYTERELTAFGFKDITYPEHVASDIEAVARIWRGELPVYRTEKRYVRKDTGIVWASVTVSAVRDEGGQPLYLLSLIEDITEHKRLEEQYLQAQEMETVGRLAGGIAHDFNNLLTAIGGYADLTRESLAPDDELVDNIDQIIKASERAAQLTQRLLAFSRRQIIQPRVIDLNQVVLELSRMLRRLIGEHIELVTRPGPDLWRVKADPGQMEQILANLAVNARDAMTEGGKKTPTALSICSAAPGGPQDRAPHRLIIETANVTLDEDFARQHLGVVPGDYVWLSVSDTGVGLTDEARAHLFEPFFTTKEPGRGTGLGLATVYGIVKQHQGAIWARSEPGTGTTFHIYLPRTEAQVEAPSPDEVEALPRGNETVLVVEDESSVQAIAVRILSKLGYTVLRAGDGLQALDVFAAHAAEIDLVATDVIMPRMDGPELAKRLLAQQPDLKVLFISGYTAESMIVQQGVLDEGIAFLRKPFTAAALARKIHALLHAPKP